MTIMLESVYNDGSIHNPFQALEMFGEDWVKAGMQPDDVVETAIELGGEPRLRNGLENLKGYAAEICLLRYRQLEIEPQDIHHEQITEVEGEA